MWSKNIKSACLLFLLLLSGCRQNNKPTPPVEGIIMENENPEDISIDLADQYSTNDALPAEQDNPQDTPEIENTLGETPPEANDYWDDLCGFITHVYGRYTHYEDDGSNDEEWWSANSLIMNLLLTYLNSTKSLERDINQALPFLECNISEDGLLRVYSWAIGGGGTFIPYNSILQYKTPEFEVTAVNIDDLLNSNNGRELNYGYIKKLKEDCYLLGGSTRAMSFSYAHTFIAFKLEYEKGRAEKGRYNIKKFVPLPVFNNSRTFSATEMHARQFSQKMVIRGVELNDEELKIIITYDEVIDDTKIIDPDNRNNNLEFYTLEFKYNGTEFTGDYEKLMEIKNSYWIKEEQ
jgi:hypothetical protein